MFDHMILEHEVLAHHMVTRVWNVEFRTIIPVVILEYVAG